MKIPQTKKVSVIEKIHGKSVPDPYRWLEEVETNEVQNWLDEENTYARSILDNFPKRNELKKEFESLFREETIGVPHPCNGKYFFIKRKADQDLGVLYVKNSLKEEARVLVDPNKISKEKGFP